MNLNISDHFNTNLEEILSQTQIDIKNEIDKHIDQNMRLQYLHAYGHLFSSLPDRFIIQSPFNNTTTQKEVPANTPFIFEQADGSEIPAITASSHNFMPIEHLNIKKSTHDHLEIEMLAERPFYLNQHHIELWLEQHTLNDAQLYWLYWHLTDQKKVHITLYFEDMTQVKCISHVSRHQNSTLPLNSQLKTYLFSPEMATSLRFSLQQIQSASGCEYVTKISITIPISDVLNQITFPISLEKLFAVNKLPVYFLQHDYSVTETLDTHHSKIELNPRLLEDYKLYYPLALYVNNQRFAINEMADLVIDQESQNLNHFGSSSSLKKIDAYIDALWTKPIFIEKYKKVYSHDPDLNQGWKITKRLPAIYHRNDNNLPELINYLNDIGFQKNIAFKKLTCLLLTGGFDYTHEKFINIDEHVTFKTDQVIPNRPDDMPLAWYLEYITNQFISMNKNQV